jgi:hypothetical protein
MRAENNFDNNKKLVCRKIFKSFVYKIVLEEKKFSDSQRDLIWLNNFLRLKIKARDGMAQAKN